MFDYLRPQPDLDLSERLVGLHSEGEAVAGGLAAGGGAHHPGGLGHSFTAQNSDKVGLRPETTPETQKTPPTYLSTLLYNLTFTRS